MVEAQLFVEENTMVKTMAEFQGLLLGLEARNGRADQAAFQFEDLADMADSIAQ